MSVPEIVKKHLRILTPTLSVLFAACSGDTITPVPGGDACAQARNPIDRALCPEFAAIDYRPLVAGSDELCTRLSVDLLGRKPTPQERAQCAQLDVADVVATYQSLDTYRMTQRRRWADHFSYSDGIVDPFEIEKLDALVERLYRGEVKYSDFAIEAISHPAFVGRHLGFGLPEDVARATIRLFLGRTPSRPEAQDLAGLWNAWMPGGLTRGYDENFFPYGMLPFVNPLLCEKDVRSCASTLIGKAAVEMDAAGRIGPVNPNELTPQDWEQLRAPGRLVVSLDTFWEARVDEVLEHYLGYNLGRLRPKVRDALVAEFKKSENLVELERMVLTSVAYTQSAVVDPERPAPAVIRDLPLAQGPSKLMTPEQWLFSLGTAIGINLGDCDFRFPGLGGDIFDPNTGQPVDLSELDDFWPRDANGQINTTFRDIAASMGGCPGRVDGFNFQVTTRSTYLGLIAAVGQEEAALAICLDSPAAGILPSGVNGADTGDASIEKGVEHIFTRLFGSASQEEVSEAVQQAKAGCPDCTAEQVARQLCSGVAAGVEYVFN